MPSRKKKRSRSKTGEARDVLAQESSVPTLDAQEQISIGQTESPEQWPTNVSYARLPLLSPWLNEKQRRWLHQKPAVALSDESKTNSDVLPIIKLPLSHDEIVTRILVKQIDHTEHPAHGQFGLFAARKLLPGELVIPYIGYVHGSTTTEQERFVEVSREESQGIFNPWKQDESFHPYPIIGSWDTSDYDLNMIRDEDLELAVDAAQIGNEARFCNDYRGVPLAESVEDRFGQSKFDRQAKRSAKSWDDRSSHQSDEHAKYTQRTSIPNAEFRDVWFEWVDTDRGDKNFDLSQGLGSLQLDKVDEVVEHPSLSNSHRLKSVASRKRKTGMKGVAIFVLPAGKSGKRKYGIPEGHEVLVSYGKGFWAHH